MRTFLLFAAFAFSVFTGLSQDLSEWNKDLNAILVQKEVYQAQTTFPSEPYILRVDIPNLYYKEFNIKEVNFQVKKGTRAELTGHLYEVLISCNGDSPCMEVNIGVGKTFQDASMRLLFEEERDARAVSELLRSFQQEVSGW